MSKTGKAIQTGIQSDKRQVRNPKSGNGQAGSKQIGQGDIPTGNAGWLGEIHKTRQMGMSEKNQVRGTR